MKLGNFSDFYPRLSSNFNDCGYLTLEGPLGIFCPDELILAYDSFIESPYTNLVMDFRPSHPDRSFYGGQAFDTFVPAKMIEFKSLVSSRNGALFLSINEEKRKSFELSRVVNYFRFVDLDNLESLAAY